MESNMGTMNKLHDFGKTKDQQNIGWMVGWLVGWLADNLAQLWLGDDR